MVVDFLLSTFLPFKTPYVECSDPFQALEILSSHQLLMDSVPPLGSPPLLDAYRWFFFQSQQVGNVRQVPFPALPFPWRDGRRFPGAIVNVAHSRGHIFHSFWQPLSPPTLAQEFSSLNACFSSPFFPLRRASPGRVVAKVCLAARPTSGFSHFFQHQVRSTTSVHVPDLPGGGPPPLRLPLPSAQTTCAFFLGVDLPQLGWEKGSR